jgi:hypothetical protein
MLRREIRNTVRDWIVLWGALIIGGLAASFVAVLLFSLGVSQDTSIAVSLPMLVIALITGYWLMAWLVGPSKQRAASRSHRPWDGLVRRSLGVIDAALDARLDAIEKNAILTTMHRNEELSTQLNHVQLSEIRQAERLSAMEEQLAATLAQMRRLEARIIQREMDLRSGLEIATSTWHIPQLDHGDFRDKRLHSRYDRQLFRQSYPLSSFSQELGSWLPYYYTDAHMMKSAGRVDPPELLIVSSLRDIARDPVRSELLWALLLEQWLPSNKQAARVDAERLWWLYSRFLRDP